MSNRFYAGQVDYIEQLNLMDDAFINAYNYLSVQTANSTTSNLIGTGSKTFTIEAGKQYAAGTPVKIVYKTTPANFFYGTVTSYSGTTLVVDITYTEGTGTYNNWSIQLCGLIGPTGPSGSMTVVGGGAYTNYIPVFYNAAGTSVTSGGVLLSSLLTTTGNGSSLTGITKSQIGLALVENTALSTWTGTTSVTTIGNATATSFTSSGGLSVGGTSTLLNTLIPYIGGISAPTSNDLKDRGIAFRWHNGTAAKVGFFGYDNSSGRLVYVPDATITSDVVSGTVGTIEANLLGNASTVTNGVYTSGSYADPAWITSLDGSKIIGGVGGGTGLSAGSTAIGFVNYAGTTRTVAQWDGGTLDPNGTTRLNYNGYLYATKFYGDGSGLSGISTTGYTSGSTAVGFINYAGTTGTSGQWDGGTTNPSGTTRLNYDGYLYATRFYGDGSQLSGISLPSGLTAGSSSNGFVNYNGVTQAAGMWDGSTTAPTHTIRLNYDGYLYATKFYGDGSGLSGISTTGLSAGDSGTGYINYSGNAAVIGQLNGGTTDPSNTTRLNYEGNLYVSNLYVSQGLYCTTTSGSPLIFDSGGHKRITYNDGGGNFNIRAGNYYNAGAVQYINDGTNGGAAGINMQCDAAEGAIAMWAAPIGTAGNTVTSSSWFNIYSSMGIGFGGGTTPTAGYFNSLTTNPTNTTRLNFEGYLYSTRFYGELMPSKIQDSIPTASGGTLSGAAWLAPGATASPTIQISAAYGNVFKVDLTSVTGTPIIQLQHSTYPSNGTNTGRTQVLTIIIKMAATATAISFQSSQNAVSPYNVYWTDGLVPSFTSTDNSTVSIFTFMAVNNSTTPYFIGSHIVAGMNANVF